MMNNKNEVQHKSFQTCQIQVFRVIMLESPLRKIKYINYSK
jgi:hypothetical protein